MINEIVINHSEKYGVIVTIKGEDEADQLDDYLSENFYIHYDLREDDGKTEFLFGQGASLEVVKNILSSFQLSN